MSAPVRGAWLCRLAEDVIVSFWLFVAGLVIVIGILSVIGAMMVRKNPDTAWEKREDHPVIGHHDV
ncbi:MAG: hypothetical protein GC206_00210 [Alphaproteobacteria bacterium]|nr:hypothetical protein [Alphaproteobacteria bacterium]